MNFRICLKRGHIFSVPTYYLEMFRMKKMLGRRIMSAKPSEKVTSLRSTKLWSTSRILRRDTSTGLAEKFEQFENPFKKEILLKISYNSRGMIGLFWGVFPSQRDSQSAQIFRQYRRYLHFAGRSNNGPKLPRSLWAGPLAWAFDHAVLEDGKLLLHFPLHFPEPWSLLSHLMQWHCPIFPIFYRSGHKRRWIGWESP